MTKTEREKRHAFYKRLRNIYGFSVDDARKVLWDEFITPPKPKRQPREDDDVAVVDLKNLPAYWIVG